MGQILNNLVAKNLNTSRSAAFEVRTLVYRGDLDESLRQLTVQQDGSVKTSSDLADLRYCQCALKLRLSNIQSIAKMDVNNSSSEKATMHWRLERVKCSDVHMDSVSTTRLDDVVSALVPLSLMGSPDFVKFLENPSIRKEYNDERLPQAHELCPKKSPGIEFSLSTRLERYNHLHRANSDIIATSRGPLIASMEGKERSVYAI